MKTVDVAAIFPENSILKFDYVGGHNSANPGVKTSRVVIVSNSNKSIIDGIDLTKNAQFRVFKKSRISNLKVVGGLVSSSRVCKTIQANQPHIKVS
jgi:hypothetical protein